VLQTYNRHGSAHCEGEIGGGRRGETRVEGGGGGEFFFQQSFVMAKSLVPSSACSCSPFDRHSTLFSTPFLSRRKRRSAFSPSFLFLLSRRSLCLSSSAAQLPPDRESSQHVKSSQLSLSLFRLLAIIFFARPSNFLNDGIKLFPVLLLLTAGSFHRL